MARLASEEHGVELAGQLQAAQADANDARAAAAATVAAALAAAAENERSAELLDRPRGRLSLAEHLEDLDILEDEQLAMRVC